MYTYNNITCSHNTLFTEHIPGWACSAIPESEVNIPFARTIGGSDDDDDDDDELLELLLLLDDAAVILVSSVVHVAAILTMFLKTGSVSTV